jgi:signal transduction histidine kinase
MRQERPFDECSALNALIQDRGTQWSAHARAIKFDIEFKAIEAERRRVAKDLHDEILPALARLIRSIQGLNSNSNHSDETNSQIVENLHDTVAAFRDLLGELHPVDLEELGLVPALSNLCCIGRFKRRCGCSPSPVTTFCWSVAIASNHALS